MVIGPQNYDFTIKSPDVFDQFIQGQQIGQALAVQEQQRALAAQQAQQQQAMAQQILSVQEKVRAGTATAQDYAVLQTLDPKNSEAYGRAFSTMDNGKRSALFEQSVPIYTALQNKRLDVAQNLIQSQLEALQNSPVTPQQQKDLQAAKTALDLVKAGPDGAAQAQLWLGSTMQGADPDRFGKLVDSTSKQAEEDRKSQLFPETFKQAKAKTTQDEAAASTAYEMAKLNLKEKGLNIKNIESQIDDRKAQRQIAYLNASIAREANAIKRQEFQLKLKEIDENRAEKLQQKAADLAAAVGSIDNMVNTADRVLQHPGTDGVVGSIAGKRETFLKDEAADAKALIDTLGSQAFISQIPQMKGAGALSEREGDKLQSSLQSLSRVQSPEQFRANVREAQRLMLKARQNIESRYGAKPGIPDTPAVRPSGKETTDLVNKYGN